MQGAILDVVLAYNNPIRWISRHKLMLNCINYMLGFSNIRLTVVECAYGERPFEFDNIPNVNLVKVRAQTLLWLKENLINVGVQHLPPDWKYLAWIDGDVTFENTNWVQETIHALQQYQIIQPWSDAIDLGPENRLLATHKSFCYQWYMGKPLVANSANFWTFNNGPYDYPHTGWAWACTRQFFDWVGGLIDIAVMGAGDHHMALALVGKVNRSVPTDKMPASYMRHLNLWQSRALHHGNLNIGFVPGTLRHHFHGSKNHRKYIERWKMITDNRFDPDYDIKKNSFGVWELAGNKPQLSHELDVYFRQRNEDGNMA